MLKTRLFRIWKEIDSDISTKFSNICGKTSQYDVPDELFQKRTSRKNRVLLPYKIYKKNHLEFYMLDSFQGGVCIELVNFDLIQKDNQKDEDFKKIKERIGSDDKISAMISFRTEDGDSGATKARESYKIIKGMIESNELDIELTPIERNKEVEWKGRGDNSVWKGNYYASIKGGQQKGFESHNEIGPQLIFNPVIDYANPLICQDIDITMSYYAMHCHDIIKEDISDFENLKKDVEEFLRGREYDEGNLLDICLNNPILKYGNGYLIDPIQFKKISINYFTGNCLKENAMVICHNQAANKEKIFYDTKQECLLTPARSTNLFWSTHLSNMMQQNYTLEEYYKEEDSRYKKRKLLK